MELGLTDKVAFITGASRGIGKAIAIALAQDGFDVAIAARDSAEKGSGVVNEAVTAMNGISGSSKKIAEITNVINEIALVLL